MGAPVAGTTVRLHLDGVEVPNTYSITGPTGTWAISIAFPQSGIHRVRAVAAGYAQGYTWSDPLNVTVAVPPDAPRNVTATPLSFDKVRLTWEPPASNGGAPITKYRVRSNGYYHGWWNGSAHLSGTTLEFVDVEAYPGQGYSYGVFASNMAGEGPSATSNSLTTPSAPTATTFTASIVRFRACNGSTCSTAAPGGTVYGADSPSFSVEVEGTVLGASGPLADVRIRGAAYVEINGFQCGGGCTQYVNMNVRTRTDGAGAFKLWSEGNRWATLPDTCTWHRVDLNLRYYQLSTATDAEWFRICGT